MSYRGIANMPGPGGSLGLCALCSGTFMAEIVMGTPIQTAAIAGLDTDVCLHRTCMTTLEKNGSDWHTLPEGPLRRAYETSALSMRDTSSGLALKFRAPRSPFAEGTLR